MCGIYGAVMSRAEATQKVKFGLKRLEYRGYDSWGIAVAKEQELILSKKVGEVGLVEKLALPAGRVVLGHTRWATHGGVTTNNAHPHLAQDGSFAVVQNGVVENYQQLKQELLKSGYEFSSETDTEVIVGLLADLSQQKGEAVPSLETVSQVAARLEGRNTIAIITQHQELLAFRTGSPLVIGRRDSNFFLSSDVLSLTADADHFYSLEPGQGIKLGLEIEPQLLTDGAEKKDKLITQLPWQKLDLTGIKLDKDGYDHFMLKEIHEQASVLVRATQQPVAKLSALSTALNQARRIYVVGAGSASYAAGQLAFWLRELGFLALSVPAYETESYRGLYGAQDLAIAISQSGETADTIQAVEVMQKASVKLATLINMPGSTLTAMADLPFMLQVGPEIGVASTKALTGQLIWSWLVAAREKGMKLVEAQKMVKSYQIQLAAWLEGPVRKKIKNLAQQLTVKDKLFVLGRGELYYPALEFALKMKEISYLQTEGFSGGELKHGVIALIEEGTPVVALVARDQNQAAMLNAVAEVEARGATVIGVTPDNNKLFSTWIQTPANTDFVAVSSLIPAQLLTYDLALERGLNPDKPRNLAKSVTVQ